MENGIRVGSVVFHKRAVADEFKGPGTVIGITRDELFEVDCFTVFWQSSGVTFNHYRSALVTLAEKEAGNVG